MSVTGNIIIDGSWWEPKLALELAKELGVISVILAVNKSGSYDLNHPDNQGGVATYRSPVLDDQVIAAQKAKLPIELYYNLNYSGDLEGGYSKTHYMHDKLVEMTKGIPFQSLWCSMEYWFIWRGAVQTKMTPQNMRAALDLERSMAKVKWPTRPWGVYSSRYYIQQADLDPNNKNADGTMKDSAQIFTWMNNQLSAKTMRWWSAYYPNLVFDATHHYTPAELLNLLSEPTQAQKRAYMFIGDNGPDVWQFNDKMLADFVMNTDGTFTAGDWDITSLSKAAYYESINWVDPDTNPPPTHTCPTGQHWDDAAGQCVPDVIVPPSTDIMVALSEIKTLVQAAHTKLDSLETEVDRIGTHIV